MQHKPYWSKLSRFWLAQFAMAIIIAISWSAFVGCGPSRSGDGPTRWTAVDKNGSPSKAKP